MLEEFKHSTELQEINKVSTPEADHLFEGNQNCNELTETAGGRSSTQQWQRLCFYAKGLGLICNLQCHSCALESSLQMKMIGKSY